MYDKIIDLQQKLKKDQGFLRLCPFSQLQWPNFKNILQISTPVLPCLLWRSRDCHLVYRIILRQCSRGWRDCWSPAWGQTPSRCSAAWCSDQSRRWLHCTSKRTDLSMEREEVMLDYARRRRFEWRMKMGGGREKRSRKGDGERRKGRGSKRKEMKRKEMK